MKTSLYNLDGSLCAEAQLLIKIKPENMTWKDWINLQKNFQSNLSDKDLIKFKKLKAKELYRRNSNKIKKRNAAWRQTNPKKVRSNNERWRTRNPEKMKKIRKNQRKSPYSKIHSAIQRTFSRIKHNKPTNTLDLLGCTWEEAKAHIESLWQEGMTWENHGLRGWHIDHIRPVSSFNQDETDVINHYTNLQPLWWYDNLSKGDKYIHKEEKT